MSDIFNFQNLIIFGFVIFIQGLGGVFLTLFFKEFVKKNNLFLNLSYGWFFGNVIFGFFIFLLFVLKKLELINLINFFVFFLSLLLLIIFLFFKNKKEFKIKVSHLFYLTLILIFFLPLIIESLTSFLLAWDGLAIWFLKAKVLFFNQNILDFLKNENFYYSSQAYPLGFPLLISSYYRLINQVNDQAVQFYLIWFYLNLIFLFFGFLIFFFEKYLSKIFLLLLTLFLFLPSNFIIYSHNGYIDLQLGYCFLVIFSLLYFFIFEEKNKAKQISFLIFLGLGFCLMLKNESLPFGLITLLILTVLGLRKFKINFFKKFFLSFFSFIPFIFWEVYRRVNQIPSFLDGNLIPKKENLIRLKVVLNYFLLEYFNTGKYGFGLIICFFLIVFFGGMIFFKKYYFQILPFFIILLFQILSYFYTFLITPFPYVVQLESSLERLFLQFIPLIYFLTIIVVFQGLLLILKKFKDS